VSRFDFTNGIPKNPLSDYKIIPEDEVKCEPIVFPTIDSRQLNFLRMKSALVNRPKGLIN